MLHSSSDMYGASKIFLLTAKTLVDRGVQVFAVLSEEGPLVSALKELGVEVWTIRLGILRRKYFNPIGIFNRIWVLNTAKRKVEQLILEKDIDTVYSNTAAVLLGSLVLKKKKVRHVWHLHEIVENPKWFTSAMKKIVHASADKIVVVSKAVEDNWKLADQDTKLVRIYNGIEYDAYLAPGKSLREELNIPEEACVVGMIGRVSAWKGQEYFLEIAEQLNKKFINLFFIMVGDAFPGGEYLYKNIKNKITEKRLESKVINLGFRTDIPDILSTLDVFILPSILPDPFPTVILEAMAAGKPIVATGHGGAKEMVVEESGGYLIPWDNAEEAASMIAPLIDDPNLRYQMGSYNRNRVLKNFSLTSFQENIVTVF